MREAVTKGIVRIGEKMYYVPPGTRWVSLQEAVEAVSSKGQKWPSEVRWNNNCRFEFKITVLAPYKGLRWWLYNDEKRFTPQAPAWLLLAAKAIGAKIRGAHTSAGVVETVNYYRLLSQTSEGEEALRLSPDEATVLRGDPEVARGLETLRAMGLLRKPGRRGQGQKEGKKEGKGTEGGKPPEVPVIFTLMEAVEEFFSSPSPGGLVYVIDKFASAGYYLPKAWYKRIMRDGAIELLPAWLVIRYNSLQGVIALRGSYVKWKGAWRAIRRPLKVPWGEVEGFRPLKGVWT